MADFTSVNIISSNMQSALSILRIFRSLYEYCTEAEKILNRYETDQSFKAEADHLFDAEQLAEIGEMISQVKTLRSGWGETHRGPLGIT